MGSIFASDTAHKVDIPVAVCGEPDQWVEIRRLSGRELEEAEQARTAAIIEQWGHMIREITPEREAAAREAEPTPAATYDKGLLLKYALLSWSFDAPTSRVDDLTSEIRNWLVGIIIEENARPPKP